MRFPPSLSPAQEYALRLDTVMRTKLTPAQRDAMVSARDRGSATAHLSGRSAFGGFEGTRASLQRRGLLDRESKLTALGRRVIDYYAHPNPRIRNEDY